MLTKIASSSQKASLRINELCVLFMNRNFGNMKVDDIVRDSGASSDDGEVPSAAGDAGVAQASTPVTVTHSQIARVKSNPGPSKENRDVIDFLRTMEAKLLTESRANGEKIKLDLTVSLESQISDLKKSLNCTELQNSPQTINDIRGEVNDIKQQCKKAEADASAASAEALKVKLLESRLDETVLMAYNRNNLFKIF